MNAHASGANGFRSAEPLLDDALVAAFFELYPDPVYFKDQDSRFVAVNRAKAERHGLEPGDLASKTDVDLFSELHAQWARADEESIMNTGEPILGKLERIAWPDGSETWARTSKLPLRDDAGAIVGTFGTSEDVTESQQKKHELEKAQRELMDASRTAGMAEMATGVLHNVGNVLTSLNVSASVIATTLHQSKADSLAKLSALLDEHQHDLAAFLTDDPKGRRVPDFIESLGRHGLEERDRLLKELGSLQQNIDHIKEIVTMQQAYATMVGVVEALDPVTLMEDAVRMNAGALARHDVAVVREFHPAPRVRAEKAKVLQILVNLIRNAKYATDEGRLADKIITLRILQSDTDPWMVRLVVHDNGIGIRPEHLARIFTHGFTTRKDGHGFGLHASAMVAKEMKGVLSVHSDGIGRGATFTLELPAAE